MARQATSPVDFQKTRRVDRVVGMTSGRAGLVVPIDYIPVLAGDSGAGRVGVDIELAEMPRPLLNGVIANVQAWLVPKTAHPRYFGFDEYRHARTGEDIKTLDAVDWSPPAFFDTLTGADLTTLAASDFWITLGLHDHHAGDVNTDLIDAFNLIYNFRLAAHSSKLTRRDYASENLANATALPRAFWPMGALRDVVPDYELALVQGQLDLDVSAGQLPVSGIGISGDANIDGSGTVRDASGSHNMSDGDQNWHMVSADTAVHGVRFKLDGSTVGTATPEIYAEMAGQAMSVTLADIDKARTTQAFAKLRAAYAGNDATGFDNDDAVLAMLMSGLRVPEEDFKRPILLDSSVVPFGFTERFATDSANLDDSVSQGRASVSLSLNVPEMLSEGMIVITLEVMPERIREAMSDAYNLATDVSDLPDALRDVQRTLPVDIVPNHRVDARHTTPGGAYGHEPMNYKWNRNFTRLGGDFYQDTPGTPYQQQRAAIWMPDVVDPQFTDDHWLCPASFPHDVFSDTLADAFEVVVRHDMTFVGLTQMGDPLDENNSNFVTVEAAGV